MFFSMLFSMFIVMTQNVFASSKIETKTSKIIQKAFVSHQIKTETFKMTGYGVRHIMIMTPTFKMTGLRKTKHKFGGMKLDLNLPIKTHPLQMTGVKGIFKIHPDFDFGGFGEEKSDEFEEIDLDRASPQGRQGRQLRLQQPGALRTNEPASPQFVPTDYNTEIR